MNVFLYFFIVAVIILVIIRQKTAKKSDKRKIVLIIDDDRAFVKMVKTNLLRLRYEVLTALTGEQGIDLAIKRKPDLIILDVILPGIKGREVCAKLKEDSEAKDIPVIFLTVKDSAEDIKAELEAGAIAHLTKPVSAHELLAEVQKILGY